MPNNSRKKVKVSWSPRNQVIYGFGVKVERVPDEDETRKSNTSTDSVDGWFNFLTVSGLLAVMFFITWLIIQALNHFYF